MNGKDKTPELLPRDLRTADFTYELPSERIADRPTEKRGASRLLVADAATELISHQQFSALPQLLPAETLLVANVTKVIAARLEARKPTGGIAEIFLLEPDDAPSAAESLAKHERCRWKCLLGGRNISAGMTLTGKVGEVEISADICAKSAAGAVVEFRWKPEHLTFGEAITHAGTVPLPPYIKRLADAADAERYQTVYAREEGAVAAPTAGLHFTPEILAGLRSCGHTIAEVILNVGLGTFKPIDVELVREVEMHAESIRISVRELRSIVSHFRRGLPVACIGTTSLRTLESFYWLGVELLENSAEHRPDGFFIRQWTPYKVRPELPSAAEALQAAAAWAEQNGISELRGSTALIIAPGYPFGTAHGLITNFHQPGSTLLLLVAAFLGNDFRRNIYESALADGYRFLSYGDCCLFWRKQAAGFSVS